MTRTRRDFLTGSAAALAGAAIGRAWPLAAWQGGAQAAPVTPVFTPIRRGVGFFTARGGTIGYLVNPSGVLVVDAQYPETAALCLAGLNERSGGRPVDALVNTHHHGDHTAGNIAFKGVAKTVVAHRQAAEHMRHPPGRNAPTAEQLYPDTTFETTWDVAIGDERIQAKHYGRAHTSGDAVITFAEANVAHMGDLMFNRRHAVIDRPAGASVAHWATVIEGALADHGADTIYIFGHAGTGHPVSGSRADLLVMRDYLTALLDFVRKQVAAGKTQEEILAIKDLLPGFDQHGPLTAGVLRPAYEEVTAASH